jgi:hypothetical protein
MKNVFFDKSVHWYQIDIYRIYVIDIKLLDLFFNFKGCKCLEQCRALAVRTFIDSNNKRQLMEFRENLSR